MQAKPCILIILGLSAVNGWSSIVRADEKSMIAAAEANAVDSLRDEVAAERIDPRLTVAEFLKQTHGEQQLRDVLQRAEEVGGPRTSSDGQACQIRVQINGDRVARELVSIAANHPKQSPLPAEIVSRQLADWRNRVFSGTGSSVSAGSAKFIRPVAVAPEDAWAGVSDLARQQAVNAARENAIRHAMDELTPISFTPGQPIGSLLANKAVTDSLSSWLNARPVRQVRFTPQREVELTLWTPTGEYCDQLLAAAKLANVPLPVGGDEDALRKQFDSLPSEVIGRAAASNGTTTSSADVAIDLPSRPPSWTEEQIIVEGVASPRSSKLKTARAAEAAAREALRKQVNALPLTETLTVGQAAERSPAIDRGITQVIEAARPFKVEYRADGSVMVRSTIVSRELWMAISEPQ